MSVSDSKDANGDVDEVTDDMITVTILVADLNEDPEFPSNTAERSVDENTAAGVNIGAPVAATDDDDDHPDLLPGRPQPGHLRHCRHDGPVADQGRAGLRNR